jgi:5'-3' exonuclease
MRDDGHAVLMEMLQDNHSHVLIDEATGEISFEGVEHFFTRLSRTETRQIEQAIHKKRMMSNNLKKSSQPSMNLGQHNWPLAKIEEECLLSPMTHKLEDRWYVRYQKQFFPGQTTESVAEVYLYGLQWIWSYYTGRMENVCFNWYYPFSLPPLWSWVVSILQTGMYLFPTTVQLKAHDIRPVEQLALVLPLESWSLIPSHAVKERKFPLLAPQFFPSSFGFESVGKRYFWECEAMIPLPSMVELKAIIS